MEALLEEKLETEAQAARAKQLLDEARAAAGRAEARVGALEAELGEARSELAAGALAREDGAAAERAPTGASQVRCTQAVPLAEPLVHPSSERRAWLAVLRPCREVRFPDIVAVYKFKRRLFAPLDAREAYGVWRGRCFAFGRAD